MCAGHAAGAIAVEQQKHAEFLDTLSSDDEAAGAPEQPATVAYTSYLLRAVHQGSFVEGVAAVLPCYWIYAKVGEHLLEKSSPDPLYARWINTYGGEEFQATVRAVLALADRVGAEISEPERARAVEHFVTTSRYEWMFWDAAWRQEAWPV
jgi:thiaminase/transcriptional activator TenA